VSSVVEETPGQRARAALDRHAWGEAYEVMADADHAGDLAPDDLEVLAQSAWWVGQQDTARDAWERAYTLHAKAGDTLAAANAAAQLAFNLLGAGFPSVLNGWVNRAERLLQGAPEQPVHGLLAVVRGMTAFTGGNLDMAAAAGRRALELGTAFGIPDLQAMGLHLEGRALVAQGRVEEGMALLDEATAAAVSGELSPQVTGRVYCSTVSACWGVADYRRAGEWADAAERWCRRRSINGFPGVCRLHRAQIHKLRGMWREAEAEALLACKELPSWFPLDLGRALSEIGEIRLRTGDLEGAEEAFLQAKTLGMIPTQAWRCSSWPGGTSRLRRPRSATPSTTPRQAPSRRRRTRTCNEPASCRHRSRSAWPSEPWTAPVRLPASWNRSPRPLGYRPCGRRLAGRAGWSSWRKGRLRRPSKASGAAPPAGLSWTHLMRPPGPGWA
jgi:tetratricopeptide (TPR) repeat protein